MSGVEATVKIEGFQNIPDFVFNRSAMRKAFRTSGNVVAKKAKRKLSGRSGTDLPVRRSGRLMRSIQVKLGSKGMYAKVQHKMPSPPSKWKSDPRGQAFYPAFLHHGTTKGVRSRGNWIADSLNEERGNVEQALRAGLLEALS